jgi:hypothetical protein
VDLESRRNALALTIGWWLLRRKVQKRAEAAIAGLIAGAGAPRASAPKRRHRFRSVLVAITLAGGAGLAWRRLRGGGNDDDWGTWKPEPPAPPAAPPAEPAPTPEPVAA